MNFPIQPNHTALEHVTVCSHFVEPWDKINILHLVLGNNRIKEQSNNQRTVTKDLCDTFRRGKIVADRTTRIHEKCQALSPRNNSLDVQT